MLRRNQEGASEKQTEDREELYAELFGNSEISEDDGDESDAHEKCVFSENVQVRRLKCKVRPLDPFSSDDEVKIETAPNHPPVQEPASEPLTSSERKSSAATAPTAVEPPQISEIGGDESDAHKRRDFPYSFKFIMMNLKK